MGATSHWALPVHCELGPDPRSLRRGAIRHLVLALAAAITYGGAMLGFLLLARAGQSIAMQVVQYLLVAVAVGGFTATVLLSISALRWYTWARHGYPPRLRLTDRGLDVRYYTTTRYDLVFPWSELQRVELRWAWRRPYLCLTPKGPHRWVPRDSRLLGDVERSMADFGAPFVVDLTFAGVSLDELDRLLRHYSGRRFGIRV
jgi:hypothetical protein